MPVVSFNSSTFLQLLNNLKILPNHPTFDSFDMHSENEFVVNVLWCLLTVLRQNHRNLAGGKKNYFLTRPMALRALLNAGHFLLSVGLPSNLRINQTRLSAFLRGRHRPPNSPGHRRPRPRGSPRHDLRRVRPLQRGCEYSKAFAVHGPKILL